MQTVTIKIGGMTCDGCVRSVSNVLSKVPGVRVREVKVGSATVDVDGDATPAKAAIEKAGFTVDR